MFSIIKKISSFLFSIKKINSYLVSAEKILLCTMVFVLLFLSFGQVVLRNLFDFGYIWVDQIIKFQVMWLCFIGAALASEYNAHLCIDLFLSTATGKFKRFLQFSSNLTLGFVCCFFIYASMDSVLLIKKAGISNAVPGVQDWVIRAIIPYFFAVTFLRVIIKIFEKNEESELTESLE